MSIELLFSLLVSKALKNKIYDKGNFRKDFTTEADVIQFNLFGNLFILGEKNLINFFIIISSNLNSVYYLNNSLYFI